MSEKDERLSNLQEQVIQRYPKRMMDTISLVMRGLKNKSFFELSEIALKRLNTELHIEGAIHHQNTILISNHPTLADPFYIANACGEAASNVQFISREEVLAMVPENLRQQIIPVGTQFEVARSGGLKNRKDIIVARLIQKLFPSTEPRETVERNLRALEIAVQQLLSEGKNIAILEGGELDEFTKKAQEGHSWPSGIGMMVDKMLQKLPEDQEAYIQLLAIDSPQAVGSNTNKKKQIRLRISPPISVRDLAKELETSPNRKNLTKKIQEKYLELFAG